MKQGEGRRTTEHLHTAHFSSVYLVSRSTWRVKAPSPFFLQSDLKSVRSKEASVFGDSTTVSASGAEPAATAWPLSLECVITTPTAWTQENFPRAWEKAETRASESCVR